jgi:hypothetical protein
MKGDFGRLPSNQVSFIDAPAAKRRGMSAVHCLLFTAYCLLVSEEG